MTSCNNDEVFDDIFENEDSYDSLITSDMELKKIKVSTVELDIDNNLIRHVKIFLIDDDISTDFLRECISDENIESLNLIEESSTFTEIQDGDKLDDISTSLVFVDVVYDEHEIIENSVYIEENGAYTSVSQIYHTDEYSEYLSTLENDKFLIIDDNIDIDYSISKYQKFKSADNNNDISNVLQDIEPYTSTSTTGDIKVYKKK